MWTMLEKFTAATARKLIAEGKKRRTGDGGGLWLDVRAPGRAQWVFRYTSDGKQREAGLGATADVQLADARLAARKLRQLVRAGTDPLTAKVAAEEQARQDAAARAFADASVERTFRTVAEQMLDDRETGWRNAKHRQQWRNTLKTYAYPKFGAVPVSAVTMDNVLSAIQPIWSLKPETASRVRGRIESVLNFAKARGWRTGDNPAVWRGHLDAVLPAPTKVRAVRHHPALPWKFVGAFVAELRDAKGSAARALEFAILTAARSGEVREMTWGEVDLAEKVWTVPAARMKARREHRVPLSDTAVALLEAMRPNRRSDDRTAIVFPSDMTGAAMSDMTLAAVIKRINLTKGSTDQWTDGNGHAVVPHGFRSTFRDWCAEKHGAPRELAEAALAHTVADAVEAAYRRGDMLDRRRDLMTAWAGYCGSSPSVVAFPTNKAS